MSSRSESAALPGSANGVQLPAHLKAPCKPLGPGSDRLSSEDIDAQIRWFFENALEAEPRRQPFA